MPELTLAGESIQYPLPELDVSIGEEKNLQWYIDADRDNSGDGFLSGFANRDYPGFTQGVVSQSNFSQYAYARYRKIAQEALNEGRKAEAWSHLSRE